MHKASPIFEHKIIDFVVVFYILTRQILQKAPYLYAPLLNQVALSSLHFMGNITWILERKEAKFPHYSSHPLRVHMRGRRLIRHAPSSNKFSLFGDSWCK